MIEDTIFMAGISAPAYKPQREPMELFEFSETLLPVRMFSFGRPAEETNVESYYLVFDDRQIPFKVLRYARNASVARPVLVLLHGMGLHIASFRGIAAHLLPLCDLVLIDYNSFAGIGWPEGGPSIRMLMHAAMRIPKELGLEHIFMGGASLGGGMSVMAALDYPQIVDALVLLNPAVFPQELPQIYKTLRVPIQGEMFMRIIPPEQLVGGVASIGYVDQKKMDSQLVDIYMSNMSNIENRFKLLDVIRQLPAHYGESERYLTRAHQLKQPVLVIWGSRDNLLDQSTGDRLVKTIPHIDFVKFSDLAHLPHEEDPDRIGPIVARFIARQSTHN